MKKIKFIMLILIMALIVIFPLAINATQVDPSDYHPVEPNATDVKDMYKFGGSIAGVVQVVGTIVSVGAMMIIGIRYMVASAEEKAEYKERMIPYIIGAVLLFGASNIVNILYNITGDHRQEISHATDEDWQGKMYDIECVCGKTQISIAIPEDNDVKCQKCGKVLYRAYESEPTLNAKIYQINDKT